MPPGAMTGVCACTAKAATMNTTTAEKTDLNAHLTPTYCKGNSDICQRFAPNFTFVYRVHILAMFWPLRGVFHHPGRLRAGLHAALRPHALPGGALVPNSNAV